MANPATSGLTATAAAPVATGGVVQPHTGSRAPARKRRPRKRPAAPRAPRAPRDPGPLYDPRSILSGTDLRDAVAQIVRGEINPQIKGLDRQARDTQHQAQAVSGRVSSYYRDLAQQEAGHQAAEQSITDRLNATLGGIGDRAQAATQAAGDQAQAAVTQDAAVRGAGLDGGAAARLAAQTAAQRGDTAAAAQTFQAGGAGQGANYESLVNALAGSSAMKGGEAKTGVERQFSSVLADITNKKKDVLASRGPLTTKTLLALRDAGFQQDATQQGLKLKSTQQLLDQANKVADRAEKAKERDLRRELAELQASTTMRGQDMTAAQRRRQRRLENRLAHLRDRTTRRGQDVSADNSRRSAGRGGGGSKGPTYGQRTAAIGQIQNAYAQIVRLQAHPNANSSEIRQLLEGGKVDGRKYDHYAINAAYDLFAHGQLSPANIAELVARGLKIPKGWQHPGHGSSRAAKIQASPRP